MKFLIALVLVLALAYAQDHCEVAYAERVDCGYSGMNP